MQKERFVEEVTIGGKNIRLTHEDLPLTDVELDEDNPRIRYRLKLEQNGKPLDEVILGLSEVKALLRDIKKNGGLRERIIVQENTGGKWKVVEGNCRWVCYNWLHQKEPTDPRWKKIPARILPKDVEPKEIAILLVDFHIAGKIDWRAHEKAGQVYLMATNLNMDLGDIATYMRTSKTTVNRYLQAYAFFVERFLKIDEGKYAREGERKWSYFDEFFKRPELKAELKANPDFGDEFCRWVGEGKLPQPVDVRRLPDILKNQDARQKLDKRGGNFAEAIKEVEATDPEQGSELFRLFARLREACTDAAQVKEILRIRTDKVARQRILDSYTALVNFMRLADVEIPKV